MLMAGFISRVLSRPLETTMPIRFTMLGMTFFIPGTVLTFSNSEIVNKVTLIITLLVLVIQIVVYIVQAANKEIAEIVNESLQRDKNRNQ